ncbi:hypothetical protein FHN55_12290 [Streptomyces sp. NP160]|uniref:hypothetical protein n=1 Tax=Streptomyces sp. NP160 TaxID=2586637 RepID=UPI001119E4DB|nr:hypothetical protein [Streptomyces sp. NP160]TNM66876.1 hypothetical protein FHN55_12290 [Streptomyces sp. NP160]
MTMRAAFVLAVALVVIGVPSAHVAAAAPPVAAGVTTTCQQLDVRTGYCRLGASAPGRTQNASASGGTSGRSSSAASCYSDWSAKVVPCSGAMGSWSNSRDCYVQPSAENPLPGSILFEGHTDGAVYSCTPDIGNQFQTAYSFWAAAPPAGPDPAQLAQEAIATMGLQAITIGMVPEAGADSVGLVGLPAWMWVAEPTATTFGPTTRTAAAGGVTVTATAKVEHVTWDLGDGTTVICGRGTPYTDAAGASRSPDCGHVYSRSSVGQPGNSYTVTATSHWAITWTGGGQTGQEEMDLTSDAAVQIGEAQAVVVS